METRIWILAVTETLLQLEIVVFLIGCQESRWEDLLLGQADPNSSDFEPWMTSSLADCTAV